MMCSNPKYTVVTNRDRFELGPRSKKQQVPCGKCISCLSNRRIEWAFRLQQELKHCKGASYFVTLTYDRENLKKANYALNKRDIQLYFKRLRKSSSNTSIRYYAVGELGSKSARPHYHILLFNAEEKQIRKSWDKGIVHLGMVTCASISYCLKYLVQPVIEGLQKNKPFVLMSRGYGLGAKYLTDEMVEWHRNDDRNYAIIEGKKTRLPRFYRDKIWYKQKDKTRIADASRWLGIKESRKELRYYVKKYGVKKAKTKLQESRNAMMSRIKIKVAFTQTI